jgi:hypothetical protein
MIDFTTPVVENGLRIGAATVNDQTTWIVTHPTELDEYGMPVMLAEHSDRDEAIRLATVTYERGGAPWIT